MNIQDIGQFFADAFIGFLKSPVACSSPQQLKPLKIAPPPPAATEPVEDEKLQSSLDDAPAPATSSSADSYEESPPKKIPGVTPQSCSNACDHYSRERTRREKNSMMIDVLEKTADCLNDCSAQPDPALAAVCVFKKTAASEVDLSECFPVSRSE